MLPFIITAKTIADAWFQAIYNIFDHGYRQDIQKGSFEKEQYRLQYPGLAVSIEYPWLDMIPVIPPAMVAQGVTPPSTEEYVHDYFANYIMDPTLAENETYKYSSRIHHPMPKGGTQFDRIVEMLKQTPYTNQAVIEIGSPVDHDVCIGNDGKLDPPCARVLDFKVIPKSNCPDKVAGGRKLCEVAACPHEAGECIENVLSLTVVMRSWDLWAGFPSNCGGFELLKQYVADECGLKNGPLYAYSAGAHIYGYQETFARIRTMKQLQEGNNNGR